MTTPLRKEIPIRADAQANRERILAAAEDVFAAEGEGGSTETVARRAGVGVGTVFRHFPTKHDLIEATVVRHFDVLVEHARALGVREDAGAALREFTETMVGGTATKILLIGLLGDSVTEPVVRASRDLRAAVGALLGRAQQQGAVRDDISVDDLYLLVRGLALGGAQGQATAATRKKALEVVMTGLRPR